MHLAQFFPQIAEATRQASLIFELSMLLSFDLEFAFRVLPRLDIFAFRMLWPHWHCPKASPD